MKGLVPDFMAVARISPSHPPDRGRSCHHQNRGFGNSPPAFLTDAQMKQEQNDIEVLIGQQLRLARKKNRVTQKDAAKVLGVSFQQLQKYENATNRLSAADLLRLSVLFDEPIDFLFQDARAALTGRPLPSSEQQDEARKQNTIRTYGLLISAISDKKFRDGIILLAKRHNKLCSEASDD